MQVYAKHIARLPFKKYLQEKKTSVYILKPHREISQSL